MKTTNEKPGWAKTCSVLTAVVAALVVALAGCEPGEMDSGEGEPGQSHPSPGEYDEEPEEGETARVTDVTVGASIGGAKQITRPTQQFHPQDTVYVSVTFEGFADDAYVEGTWYREGEEVARTRQRISPNGKEITEMHISEGTDALEVGEYLVEVQFNDTVVEAVPFEVVPEDVEIEQPER